MSKSRFLTLSLVLLVGTLLFLSTGCTNRAASAQKLFDQGEYQQVINKYPDLEVARRAHAKLAEELLQKKDYSAVLRDYADTPAAFKAKVELAQRLYDEGKYQAVLDSFPQSPVAAAAKEKLSDSLYAAGDYDKLIAWYPETVKAKQVKEDRAKVEFARIKKLPKKDKAQALELFMKQYAGTEEYKDAADMLNKIRIAESNQANKKK
jgi:hypothetical protein